MLFSELIRMDQLRISCSMRSTKAVTILGQVGIIISVLIIIGGIICAAIPTTGLFIPSELLFIIPGVIIILVGNLLLTINSILIKRNRDRRFGKVKSLIQIICKVFISLELICSFFLLISMITMISQSFNPHIVTPKVWLRVYIIVTVLALIWIVFICLAIHGIRKKRTQLLNAYIIFNLIMGPIAFGLLTLWIGGTLIAWIPSILGSIGLFLYHIGFFVVLSNIMMVDFEDEQQMKDTEKLIV